MYETLIWEETFPGCSLNEHNWNRRVGNWQLSSDGQLLCQAGETESGNTTRRTIWKSATAP